MIRPRLGILALSLLLACPTLGAPLVSAEITLGDGCTGTFLVGPGIAKNFYYRTGNGGRNGLGYAEGEGQGRETMDEHDGDWVSCGLILPDSCHWSVGPGTEIVLLFADGRRVVSTEIVVTDEASRSKQRVAWSSAKSRFWFDGTCPYRRHRGQATQFELYVRFPEASILSDNSDDDTTKPFRVAPIGVVVTQDRR